MTTLDDAPREQRTPSGAALPSPDSVVLPSGVDRPRGWYALPTWVRRFGGPILLLILWQVLSSTGILTAQMMAPPAKVISAGWELSKNGEYPNDILVSLKRVAWGLFFGGLAGVSIALVAGLFKLGDDLLGSSMEALRAVPVIGLLPLVIVWFGIGEQPKIVILAIGVAFPIYVNTHAGIRGIDNRLIETGTTFGLSRRGLVRRVIIPGAIPNFLVGLRLAVVGAILYLVFVEQLNAQSGIGFVMNRAQAWNRTDIIVLCLATYAVLGLLADAAVRLLERRLLVWRRGFAGA